MVKAHQAMVPPVPYFGAKGKMAPLIAALLPRHRHYVEVFGGSLAVLFAKPPSYMETVNDLDAQLMTFWRVVRDRFEEFEWACATTPHARDEMKLHPSIVDGLDARTRDVLLEVHAYAEELRERYNLLDSTTTTLVDKLQDLHDRLSTTDTDLEVARRVWSRLIQGRMGKMDGGPSNWRYRVDTSVGPIQGYLRRGLDRLHPAAKRLWGVSIENLPALDVIEKYGGSGDVCLYVDPPYLGGTRDNDSVYRYEMASAEEHTELARALSEVDAAVVVSGYRSELYDSLYSGWYVEEWPTSTTQGGAGKATCEVLWANRPLGNRVQLSLFDGLNRQPSELDS